MEKADTARLKPSEKKKMPEAKEKSQAERFIEAARLLNADESGKSFETAASKILSAKQTPALDMEG